MSIGRNRGTNNTFWTIIVAIETVILQIFDDKRIFIITAVFILGALIWEFVRRSQRKKPKPVLNTPIRIQQSSRPVGRAVYRLEDSVRREQEYKDLLSAGVIDSAEYYDRMAELKSGASK
ncbi:hypothetical protein SDC9_163239 [bioreactor metagenome]|uniref:Uncharacterized protein n=1 Tax=bioreactor metagenome TaxID=1076179 RepID=A0A645FV30_9ZZZZ